MSDTITTTHPCGQLAVQRCYPPRSVKVPKTNAATIVVKRACPKCGTRWQATCRPVDVRGQGEDRREYRQIDWVRTE